MGVTEVCSDRRRRRTSGVIGALAVMAALAAPPADAAFPGANGRIIYTDVSQGPVRIISRFLDGSGQINLGAEGFSPSYSPDGSQVTYDLFSGPVNGIWTMTSEGRRQQRISPGTAHPAPDPDRAGPFPLTHQSIPWQSPQFSPDATQIVAAGPAAPSAGGDGRCCDLWVMDVNGTNRQRLTSVATPEGGSIATPTFSPDGTKIAFAMTDPGASETDIAMIDAAGGVPEKLEDTVTQDRDPDFSPDGTKIVFESQREANRDIYTIDVVPDIGTGTRAVQRLTTDPSFDMRPKYSPDGSRIIFRTGRGGSAQLYTMFANGANQFHALSVDSLWFSWQPLQPSQACKLTFPFNSVTGNDRNNFPPAFVGSAGNDLMFGFKGNDTGSGEQGDDCIYGAEGNDDLTGKQGNDLLDGGPGRDRMFGNGGDDTAIGGGGRDKAKGHDGNDTLKGDAGEDGLRGGDDDDKLVGGPGDDELKGEAGDDDMRGGPGNDRLIGGPGANIFNCGSGRRDVAIFSGRRAKQTIKRNCERVQRG